MGAGGVDDPAPARRLHVRHGEAAGVKGAGKVEGNDLVPLLDRKVLDRGDVLDAGVVDQHVDRPGLFHQLFDALGGGQVRPAVACTQLLAQGGDRIGIAKAVEHHLGAFGPQGAGDGKADARG